jgi:hypothetical protein
MALACHEASHAIAGELTGFPVEQVTILPGHGFSGHVRFGAYQGRNPRARLRAEIIMSLAGSLGESEYTHERVRLILRRCDYDRRQARKAAMGYAFGLADEQWHRDAYRDVLDQCLAEARDIVRANWLSITLLATKLARNGTLTGADVCRALEMHRRAQVAA